MLARIMIFFSDFTRPKTSLLELTFKNRAICPHCASSSAIPAL